MSKKQIRQGVRLQVSNELAKLKPQPPAVAEPKQLRVSIKKLQMYLNRLQLMDEEVFAELSKDQVEAEIKDSATYNDGLLEKILDAELTLESLTAPPMSSAPHDQNVSNSSDNASLNGQSQGHVKLRDLELPSFNGDYMSWQHFWGSFRPAVHENPKLTDVQRFSYLRMYLKGDALRLADGYQLTPENYAQVIDALKERYGDPQLAIFAHLEALLALDVATNHDVSELQQISAKCDSHIRSLVALGLAEDQFAIVFAPIILSKLPRYVKTEICRKNGRNKWTLDNIREWLKDEIRARELGQSSFRGVAGIEADKYGKERSGAPKSRHLGGNKYSTASSLVTPAKYGQKQSDQSFRCAFCQMNHASVNCPRFTDVVSRKQALSNQGLKLCYRCLGDHHRDACRSMKSCIYCRKSNHHSSLCPVQFPSSQMSPVSYAQGQSSKAANSKAKATQSSQTTAGCAVASSPEIGPRSHEVAFLPTAVTKVQDTHGSRTLKARLLMDTASSRSFITDDLCRQLGLEVKGSSFMSVGRFGSDQRSTSTTKIVQLNVLCADGALENLTAHVTPLITCPIARAPIDPKKFPVVTQIPLAEPLNEVSDELPLDILIGSDHYYKFVPSANTITCDGGPVFVNSRLGFLTAGTMSVEDSMSPESTLVLLLTEAAPGRRDGLDSFAIERFWQLEDVGVKGAKDSQMEVSDEEALRKFEESVKFVNGRYYVKLPWKVDDPDLPDNYKLAFGRLKSVHNRLKQNPEVLQTYDDIIKKQLDSGIVEVAPGQQSGIVYYLPHHEVLTPSKTTTKTRMVFDASSKVRKDALSLNDCLHRGMVILDDLCGLIMRFRMNRIGIVSDIEKAFLQVRLQESDRDACSFLWLKDPTQPPSKDNLVVYRFTSVFFGAVASPFLLGATIDYHLRKSNDPVASRIRENLYVDNVIAGENSVEEAVHHYQKSKELFLGCSMNLREYHTNSPEVANEIATEDRGQSKEPSVLGLKWSLEDDSLHCKGPKVFNSGVVTKRVVVRQVAQVFDPCGWFAPVTVNGKILVQELWKRKVEWDDPVPENMVQQWSKVRCHLKEIPKHAVPRYVGCMRGKLQLHAFCDASGKAAAAAVYLRKESTGQTSCDLLFAKTRLPPISPVQTIPRLELIAVGMGVEMITYVEKQLRVTVDSKFVWTDSQCVLQWLTKEKLSTPFVKKRIAEIKKVSGITFRFVRSGDNPADMPSRGCDIESLNRSIWWHGPTWLIEAEVAWPQEFPMCSSVDGTVEQEVVDVIQMAVTSIVTPEALFALEDYSSLLKVLRITAYVKRFIRNVQLSPDDRRLGCLNLRELSEARLYWEHHSQREAYPNLVAVREEYLHKVAKRSSLSQLNIFRDSQGILRCATRLENSSLSYDCRNPVLLPKSLQFTMLVIQWYHFISIHAGADQTLAMLRCRYWLIHGRSQVKRVVRECRRCRRVLGGPYQIPPAPPLPKFRVCEQAPFTYTGLDYMGPLHIKVAKDSKEMVDVWICLFTCAVVRAVHLEVVENQTSEEFHLCLRRFFALYGTPTLLVADKGSQFRPVDTAMRRMCKESEQALEAETEDFLTANNVEWKYIPAKAAWMGGFYERMVGTVKAFLKKALDTRYVTPSELRTVVAEVAAIVNSRPLLYVEEGVRSMQLCPNDFLGKTRKSAIPTYDEKNVPENFKTTADEIVASWKRLQAITSDFWELWRQGYLTSLRQMHVNAVQRNPSLLQPAVGSVVQVKDPKMPRARWRLGTVVKTIKSKDQEVRVVVLRKASGRKITRPIRLLYPLELGRTTPVSPGKVSPVNTKAVSLPQPPASAGATEQRPTVSRSSRCVAQPDAAPRPIRSAARKARDAIGRTLRLASEGSGEDLSQ